MSRHHDSMAWCSAEVQRAPVSQFGPIAVAPQGARAPIDLQHGFRFDGLEDLLVINGRPDSTIRATHHGETAIKAGIVLDRKQVSDALRFILTSIIFLVCRFLSRTSSAHKGSLLLPQRSRPSQFGRDSPIAVGRRFQRDLLHLFLRVSAPFFGKA